MRKLHSFYIEHHASFIAAVLVIYDYLALCFSYLLALWIRFDCQFSAIPNEFFSNFEHFIFIYALIGIVLHYLFGLYKSIWRFASINELIRCVLTSVLLIIIHFVSMLFFFGKMPVSYYIFGGTFEVALVVGIRFMYRLYLYLKSLRSTSKMTNVLLYGAGNAGQMILRDLMLSKDKYHENVACIIDDNSNKWNRTIDGVVVYGGKEKLDEAIKKYNIKKIYLAIPSADKVSHREIVNLCIQTGYELKNLPSVFHLMSDNVNVSNMENISVEDLLGRETNVQDNSLVYDFLHDKVVLVTGGGGSIGSELCRQIALQKPATLVIFDIYENNAYDIQLELKDSFPYLDLKVIIGSVRDTKKLDDLFRTYRPDVVYHAAAHKHVPLMEDSPCEAIKNNVFGTYKTAYMAMLYGTKHFVLISTDKAVNPTNIMGASKRICEMIIQSFARKINENKVNEIPSISVHDSFNNNELNNSNTEFAIVRFGNVLGSNGSVIPLFKKQIEKGGPVTVTHPDIIRYFMTIPEAVSLVLQAGAFATGGEIFVLDMGDPVKIDTLARNMIRLAGLIPDEDIKIVYTGLRPGEKLYEERLMSEEGLQKTDNEKISIGMPIEFDIDTFYNDLKLLMNYAYDNDSNIKAHVQQMVSTYKPQV